ncbi:MAG: DUF2807 domain-containing protein [Chitinophagaceae bacterium]
MKALIQKLQPFIVKIVLPSLFLLFSFKTVEGRGIPDFPKARKELKVDGNFQNIRFDGKASVILTNEPAGTIIIEGKESDLKRIKHALKNNTLTIDVNRLFSSAKLTIYVSALSLQNIQVNGDSDVSSIDFIKSQNLHIFMNGNILVKVKTLGKVSVESPDDIEIFWKSPEERS